MTDERLAEIEALLGAATPGPWYAEAMADPEMPSQYSWRYIPDVLRSRGYLNSISCGEDVGTAEFIAASPTVVAELLDEVKRLRAQNDAIGVRLAVEASKRRSVDGAGS